jgi:Fur family ferric uptake transcriptional regulator
MSKTDLVIDRLRSLGHRVTASRRAVVEAVAISQGHVSVDDIRRRAPGVGRATVFRTMKLLVDLELVCRVLLEDGSLRYRLSHRPTHHHHLVCTACGSVEDFADCDLGPLAEELSRRTAYQIQGHWLELYGLCPDCRAPAAIPTVT